MRFVECPQGSAEWFAARCSKITASEFVTACSTVGGLTEQQEQYVAAVHAGMTEKEAATIAGYKAVPTSDIVRRALAGESTEGWSDTAKRYAADLAIERISGQPHGEPPKAWVLERGHIMETAARRLYEGRTGAFVTEAGICLTDDGVFGYSSDGLVDDDGLIEIKAPIDSTKILAMWQTGDTSEYDHQMQGGMWITGRKWCDFIMYVPDLACICRDLYVKRVPRDDAFIDAMVERLAAFDKLVEQCRAALRGPVDDVVDAEFDGAAACSTSTADHARIELLTEADAVPASLLTPDEAAPAEAVASLRPVLNPAAAWPAPATAPTLRLGQINDRIAPLAISAEGLRTLGFAHAARDKAAMLYHEHDFPSICAALIRHISAIQTAQAA